MSLIKTGTGTWTISQYQNHTGNTLIKQGTLAMGPSGNLNLSPVVQVFSGAKLDVHNCPGFTLPGGQTLSGSGTVIGDAADSWGSYISAGDTSGAGTLTFNNYTGVTNTFTLAGGDYINYKISGATADLLDVKGNLTLSSYYNTIINVLPNQVVPGTVYTVANVAGTLTNGTYITVDSSTTRYTFTPSVSLDGKQILLTADSSGSNMSLAWNGGSGNWDINTTPAWNTSDTFFNADDVTFGDTLGTTAVNIDTPVRPASITVNSSNNYTFATTTDTPPPPPRQNHRRRRHSQARHGQLDHQFG